MSFSTRLAAILMSAASVSACSSQPEPEPYKEKVELPIPAAKLKVAEDVIVDIMTKVNESAEKGYQEAVKNSLDGKGRIFLEDGGDSVVIYVHPIEANTLEIPKKQNLAYQAEDLYRSFERKSKGSDFDAQFFNSQNPKDFVRGLQRAFYDRNRDDYMSDREDIIYSEPSSTINLQARRICTYAKDTQDCTNISNLDPASRLAKDAAIAMHRAP